MNGITPSVARAASVGDSLLDSICKDNTTGRREGLTTNGEGIVSDDHVASWAEHSLPPDQVIHAMLTLLRVSLHPNRNYSLD